jgi:hypothetical protein
MMIPKYGKGFRLAVHLHKMLMLPTQLLVVILLVSSALEAVNAADNPDFACPTMEEPPEQRGLVAGSNNQVSLDTFRWLVGCNKEELVKRGSKPATYGQLQAYYLKKLKERFKAWEKSQTSPEGEEPPPIARKVPLCITVDQAQDDPRLKRFIPILKDLEKKEKNATGFFANQPKVW